MVSYAVVSAHALLRAPAATWVCVMWGRAGVVGGGVRFQGSAFFHECPLQMRALRKPTLGPHVTFFPGNMLQGYQISSPEKKWGYPRYRAGLPKVFLVGSLRARSPPGAHPGGGLLGGAGSQVA